jgi:putative membrane protein
MYEGKTEGMTIVTVILATTSTICIVISAILIAIGWYTIRVKRNRKRHKKLMISAEIFALVFFIIYMTRTTFLGNVMFNGPDSFRIPYTIFLTIHIVLSTIGAILGLTSLYLGLRGRFERHKKISPYTAVIWFITAFSGLAVYLMLFVIWPSDNLDTNLVQAIINH